MKKPRLLHIETSGKVCSICISYGDSVISLQESTAIFSHASEITLLIEKAMTGAEMVWADLSAVVVCDGPGSYTGLRVGLSVAKGLCYSLKIPLIAVNGLASLASFAQAKHPGCQYFPMIDARRMEVYMAGYDGAMNEILPIGAVILTDKTFNPWVSEGKIVLCGSGVEKSKEMYASTDFIFDETRFSSTHLVLLGVTAFRRKEFVDVASHTPFYLKPPNITKPKH